MELDGVIGFGKHKEMGKNEHQPFLFLSLGKTQPGFEVPLRLSLVPSRGKGRKVAQWTVLPPGDKGLNPWG